MSSKTSHMIWLISILSCLQISSALIRHCYPNTDDLREQQLLQYPGMKEFLETHPQLNGRLGLLHFVNWQDPQLQLKLEESKLPKHLKDVVCRWKMLPTKIAKEAEEFNKKVYTKNELHSDPVNNRNYFRTVACITDKCIQYWNIFVRPLSKPMYPVQVYYKKKREVDCSLKFMDDPIKNFHLETQNPPYIYEWTGPKDCKEENWFSDHETKCKRYRAPSNCASQFLRGKSCELDLSSTVYPDTKIIFKGKKIKGPKGTYEFTQHDSILQINSASKDHHGKWRCIVYDQFALSSEPDKDGAKFLELQDVIHRDVVFIHCKDMLKSILTPLAIMLILLVFTLLCMGCAKQCTDFDSKVIKEAEAEEVQLKKSEKLAAANKESNMKEIEVMEHVSPPPEQVVSTDEEAEDEPKGEKVKTAKKKLKGRKKVVKK